MDTIQIEQLTFLDTTVDAIIQAFLIERTSKNLSPKTIKYYSCELRYFLKWLNERNLFVMEDLSPNHIRNYLTDIGSHRNKGGVHASYRAIKAMLNFYEDEFEPPNYKNPIKKVKIQRNTIKPLAGISIEDVKKFLSSIDGVHNIRDYALFHCLVSSGCRATEFLDLNVSDINLVTGEVTIWHGKGDKYRTTFIGKEARKALRKYLQIHPLNVEAIWVNDDGDRLTISGLRYAILKYCKKAGIEPKGAHDFRRCFALACYRKGVDILSISMLLGHSSVEVTKRYLNINTDDLRIAHARGNPLE